jgi:hypothetical protein
MAEPRIAGGAEPIVARIFGKPFQCKPPSAADDLSCVEQLHREARAQSARSYLERHRLTASAEEIDQVFAYQDAFDRQDRQQRARKLVELDTRLGNPDLERGERERLEAFRRVLQRLSRYDEDIDAGLEPRPLPDVATARSWVEAIKLHAALYAQFGGIVGVAAFGAYAHGAVITLIEQHMASGDIQVLDPGVAQAYDQLRRIPPLITHPRETPDFTPFWARPIPKAYFPD